MRQLTMFIGVLILMISCEKEMPVQQDGRMHLEAVIADTSNVMPFNAELGYAPLTGAKVTLSASTYFDKPAQTKKYEAYTDSAGRFIFEDLPGDQYKLDALYEADFVDPSSGISAKIKLRASNLIDLYSSQTLAEPLFASMIFPANLIINEIYYCGPENRAYYFYDQFVELYNASEDMVYLDGKILCRARQYQHPEMETVDFVQAIYVFQFPGTPGTGRDYPLMPGYFCVVAGDAINHSEYIPTAVDLSGADWEFYNPYGNDIDNPAPNVVNVLPDKTTDMMINVSHNAVILADGTDFYVGEVNPDNGYEYIHIPLKNVLDIVEYSSDASKQKEITTRMDAGFAGVGITKYSGKSVERRLPGFDTNNSSLDFVNLDTPTPGYQH